MRPSVQIPEPSDREGALAWSVVVRREMNALEAIRAKIPAFPGYDDEASRMKSDELVRSYAGEALVRLNVNHADYLSQQADEYGDLLLRCGFANQEAFKPYQHAKLSAAQIEALAECDAALIEVAGRAASIERGDLDAYVKDMRDAFDRRDNLMRASKPG